MPLREHVNADKVIDYDNIGSNLSMLSTKTQSSEKTRADKEASCSVNAVYQLPPNKPAFIPTQSREQNGIWRCCSSKVTEPSGQTYKANHGTRTNEHIQYP